MCSSDLLTRVQTNGYNPYDMWVQFMLGNPNGLLPGKAGQNIADPKYYADNLAFNSVNQIKDTLSFLNESAWRPDTLRQTNYMAKLDFEVPLKWGDKIAGYLKFGGKYQTEDRRRHGIRLSDQMYSLKPTLTDLANKNDPRPDLDRKSVV